METTIQSWVARIILGFCLGLGAAAFFIWSGRRFDRSLDASGQSAPEADFKEILIEGGIFGLGVACLTMAIFVIGEGYMSWAVLLLGICFGIFALPVSIVGSQWQIFRFRWRISIFRRLFCGDIPFGREREGRVHPGVARLSQADPSAGRLPRRTKITVFMIALLVFIVLYVSLAMLAWHGTPLSGLVFRLLFSGAAALGVFQAICSVALSRRLQKLRDGVPLHDGF